MTSLRAIASCISITGEISIIRDFFGYKSGVYGHIVIETEDEAFDLIDEFSAAGGGMDVFFVKDIDFGLDGGTPSKDPEGTVVQTTGTTTTGIALAHELGHFLGLDHVSLSTNLMSEDTFPKFPFDLTSEQID